MRNEFKQIAITIGFTKAKRNTEIKVTRCAELEYSIETTFESIERFLEDFKKVLKMYKNCAKEGTFCSVYLSVSTFQVTRNSEFITQTNFDGWKYEGNPNLDADENGLYLSPDLKYTEAERDIFIDFSESIISQLAQAHI